MITNPYDIRVDEYLEAVGINPDEASLAQCIEVMEQLNRLAA